MSVIKTKDVLTYVTMPRVVPRVRSLLSSGFAYIAFLMAQIYFMARLLPRNHPYLQPQNMGKFGVVNVVSEATRHLKFSRKNLDQIFIYMALLAGIVVLLAQIFVMVYAALIAPAMAFSWFDTTSAADDVAYNLLDQIFGIPEIFCSFDNTSCTSYSQDPDFDGTGGPDLPLPFHIALHGLFQFYSTALLMIAVLIFLYFIVVLLVETVTTGTPFGQRFQNVWAPIRLIVALFLLMPVPAVFTNVATGATVAASGGTVNVTGLNSGQYIVLYVAKYASSFATNGWNTYNQAITSSTMFTTAATDGVPLGERYSYLLIPEPPNAGIEAIVEAMSLVHTCAYAYHRMTSGLSNVTDPSITTGYPDLDANYTDGSSGEGAFMVAPYLLKQVTSSMGNVTLISGTGGSPNIVGDNSDYIWIEENTTDVDDAGEDYSYAKALGFYYGSDIIIRFGERKLDSSGNTVHQLDTAGVKSLCGDVRVPIRDLSDAGGSYDSRGGGDHMQRFYYQLVLDLWFDAPYMRQFARGSVTGSVEKDQTLIDDVCDGTEPSSPNGLVVNSDSDYGLPQNSVNCKVVIPSVYSGVKPSTSWSAKVPADMQAALLPAIILAWERYIINGLGAAMDDDITNLGWGGAGVWYNKIAEINGGWLDGVRGTPVLDRYPLIMEEVRTYKMQHVEKLEGSEQFNPTLKSPSAQEAMKEVVTGRSPKELDWVAEPLSDVYSYWRGTAGREKPDKVSFNQILTNSISVIFGLDGLQSMRKANMHMHPLAQLVGLGKGLVDSAVSGMALSSGTAFLGGLFKKYQGAAAALEAASQVFYSVAFMGITAGFVLFYVLPFMPFVYFFFAVSSWLKAIFEAMVGVPLWALAHLRIDGEGLPGDSAQNGYFLILEIFVRPILTVVGLVAAISIFGMQVRTLNLIWDLVLSNISGHNASYTDIVQMQDNEQTTFSRGVLDEFFFTIIYALVCYMMAMASFKLIDKIPDNILRWAGAGVSSFGDIEQDNVESLNRYAAMGGMTIGNQAAGAVRDVAKGTGGSLGSMMNSGPAGK